MSEPRYVFIVVSEHCDDTTIRGVYASAESAMSAHPGNWAVGGEDYWYLPDVSPWQSETIVKHEVLG